MFIFGCGGKSDLTSEGTVRGQIQDGHQSTRSHTRSHTDTEPDEGGVLQPGAGGGVEAMISVPVRPIARRATNTFRGGMLRGAVPDSGLVASGPSRTCGDCDREGGA